MFTAPPPATRLDVPPYRILVVTYDLKTPGKDYGPLYEVLKQQGQWWHYITSTWLIYTAKTPLEVHAAVTPHIAVQDYVLIASFERPYWGQLPKDAWGWLKERGFKP